MKEVTLKDLRMINPDAWKKLKYESGTPREILSAWPIKIEGRVELLHFLALKSEEIEDYFSSVSQAFVSVERWLHVVAKQKSLRPSSIIKGFIQLLDQAFPGKWEKLETIERFKLLDKLLHENFRLPG